MTFTTPDVRIDVTDQTLREALADHDLVSLARQLGTLDLSEILDLSGRLEDRERAVVFRLLPKGQAIEVFERLDPALQHELLHDLQSGEVGRAVRRARARRPGVAAGRAPGRARHPACCAGCPRASGP
jgi:Mg/Co/Ni transporter MgtE